MVSSRIKPLKLLYFVIVSLTPHHIGVGSKITLISITPHVLEIFVMPTSTFINTPIQLVFIAKIDTPFMGNVEHVEEIGIKQIEETTKQPTKVVKTVV